MTVAMMAIGIWAHSVPDSMTTVGILPMNGLRPKMLMKRTRTDLRSFLGGTMVSKPLILENTHPFLITSNLESLQLVTCYLLVAKRTSFRCSSGNSVKVTLNTTRQTLGIQLSPLVTLTSLINISTMTKWTSLRPSLPTLTTTK